MNLDLYFATPIYWLDTDLFTEDLIDLCDELRSEGKDLSNVNGFQSNDLIKDDHPSLLEFGENVEDYCRNISKDYDCKPLEVRNLWFNVNSRNSYNQTHNHPGSIISGVFYLKADEGSGEICFHRNPYEEMFFGTMQPKSVTELNAMSCRYKPVQGRLLLFPSYLLHSVLPNSNDNERISLSFNMSII